MSSSVSKSGYKIVILGEGCVGKTSLVTRFIKNDFTDKHYTTLQAAFEQKTLNLSGKRITLNIWDTAGQERYHALGPIYYRDSHGAILVYDITDVDSFQRVKNWLKELRTILGNSCSIMIVGNKSDLEKDRHVDVAEAESYSKSVNAPHYLTSAKLNRGVGELFYALAKAVSDKPSSAATGRSNVRSAVQLEPDDDPSTTNGKKRSCC